MLKVIVFLLLGRTLRHTNVESSRRRENKNGTHRIAKVVIQIYKQGLSTVMTTIKRSTVPCHARLRSRMRPTLRPRLVSQCQRQRQRQSLFRRPKTSTLVSNEPQHCVINDGRPFAVGTAHRYNAKGECRPATSLIRGFPRIAPMSPSHRP